VGGAFVIATAAARRGDRQATARRRGAAAPRIAKDKQLEIRAAQIRFRAHRLGELLVKQLETVGFNKGGGEKGIGRRGKECGTETEQHSAPPTLAEAGIDRKQSSSAQRLAELPAEKFEGAAHLPAAESRCSSAGDRGAASAPRRSCRRSIAMGRSRQSMCGPGRAD
jgi:hypothetical protein